MKWFLLVFLLPLSAFAQTGQGPRNQCVQALSSAGSTSLISNLAMSSSRSFSINRDNLAGGFNLLRLFLNLTDANTSITRFDLTCTVSDDGNSTDYIAQECTVAAGVATCVDAGVWQKASPATKKWSYRLDTSGWNDVECTASVGTGSGAAADLLTVTGSWCVE